MKALVGRKKTDHIRWKPPSAAAAAMSPR